MGMDPRNAKLEVAMVPEAPAIPGLTFRLVAGETDFPAMVDVFNRSQAADGTGRVTTLEELANFYSHFANFDPSRDLFLAQIGGTLVGCAWTSWRDVVEGYRLHPHGGLLVPEWRRKGIGRALLRLAQRRVREIVLEQPGGPEAYLQAHVCETEAGAVALLVSDGYSAVRDSCLMVRPALDDLPQVPLPARLEIRPVLPKHLRAIWEANVDAFRDHWGDFPRTEADYLRWLGEPTADPSLWRVAWDGDQVAGMVLSFINPVENAEHHRLRGHTEDICVRRPWRHKGLARALIVESLQALKERGMTEAALGVDADNKMGALRLYESLGYRPVKRWTFYRKRLD
jgi:ribosomal protein S18 acetylase RimI-like enzyme